MKLYNSSGAQIGSSTKGGNAAENITMALNAGTYYVHVYPFGGSYSSSYYRLSVATTTISVIGTINSNIINDVNNSNSWGKEENGIRVYMAEHGSYNVIGTGYDANFLIYKNKQLVAVLTGCSTLPDAPKAPYSGSYDKNNQYSAILKDGAYQFTYYNSNYKNQHGYCWLVGGGGVLDAIRWNGSTAFVSSQCTEVIIHKGFTKKSGTTTGATSTGCLTIYNGTSDFYSYIGSTGGTLKIVRDTPAR